VAEDGCFVKMVIDLPILEIAWCFLIRRGTICVAEDGFL
jgi:hypothetical protein